MECDTNEVCPRGLCCDAEASSPTFSICTPVAQQCYALDGSLGLLASCSNSANCATKCCDEVQRKCLPQSVNCRAEGGLQTTAVIIIVFVVLLAVGGVVAAVLVVHLRRKRRKVRSLTANHRKETEHRLETLTMSTPRHRATLTDSKASSGMTTPAKHPVWKKAVLTTPQGGSLLKNYALS